MPPLQPRNRPGGQPGEEPAHAGLLHLFHAELLHLFSGIDFRWREKRPVCVTHGAVLGTWGAIFFGAPTLLIVPQWKPAALTEFICLHNDYGCEDFFSRKIRWTGPAAEVQTSSGASILRHPGTEPFHSEAIRPGHGLELKTRISNSATSIRRTTHSYPRTTTPATRHGMPAHVGPTLKSAHKIRVFRFEVLS